MIKYKLPEDEGLPRLVLWQLQGLDQDEQEVGVLRLPQQVEQQLQQRPVQLVQLRQLSLPLR